MPCLAIKSLAKALLASISAALALGPKHLTPAASRSSARPRHRYSSGPTITRAMPFLMHQSTTALFVLTSRSTLTALDSVLVPAFPGAT
uniref:Putative secreted protein n=1 Tax=Ixodes ricinus TaxID=34613 RepID=A0A6B0U025_IXORI